MKQISLSSFLVVIPSIISIIAIILAVLKKRENRLLSQQLTETTVSLELTRKQLAEIREKNAKINEFQNSLQVAELTTKFQKPRLDAQHIAPDNSPPGKYSSIQALAQKGMSIDEIASVLAISTHEAHQLVNLSKLAQGNFTG